MLFHLRGKTDAESMALANLVKDTTATTKSLNKTGARLNNKLRVVESDDIDDFQNILSADIQAMKNIAENARNAGIFVNMDDSNKNSKFCQSKRNRNRKKNWFDENSRINS